MTPADPDDERLTAALRALPTPATPPDLGRRVRTVIRRRRARRVAAAAAPVAALALVLVAWRPWAAATVDSARAPVLAHEIPQEDLAVLFAPPPVDELTVLATRDDVSVAAIGRLEGVK
jgi:hypothetical protein